MTFARLNLSVGYLFLTHQARDMANGTARYSDDDLIEFKTLVDTKLTQANEQLQSLQDQILEITENAGDEHGGDWMDDSSINNEVEMLNTMAIRQRKYIKDLEMP